MTACRSVKLVLVDVEVINFPYFEIVFVSKKKLNWLLVREKMLTTFELIIVLVDSLQWWISEFLLYIAEVVMYIIFHLYKEIFHPASHSVQIFKIMITTLELKQWHFNLNLKQSVKLISFYKTHNRKNCFKNSIKWNHR